MAGRTIELQEPIDLAKAGVFPCVCCDDYDKINSKCPTGKGRCFSWGVYLVNGYGAAQLGKATAGEYPCQGCHDVNTINNGHCSNEEKCEAWQQYLMC